MASAPFRTDSRLLQPEDWTALQETEQARLARGLHGLGLELREFISRHTPPKVEAAIAVPPMSVITVSSRIVLIDCFVPVWCPKGSVIVEDSEQIASRFRGEFELTPESLALHLDPGQEGDGVMGGMALRTALAGTPVLPANILDYLLKYPELIPESWKGKAVLFWGTVYRVPGGSLYVRFLCWGGGGWGWHCGWLGSGWGSRFPAAVSAS